MPLIRMATLGSKPISSGASTVAPNIATPCCTPIAIVCGQGSRSSGATTTPGRALRTRHWGNRLILRTPRCLVCCVLARMHHQGACAGGDECRRRAPPTPRDKPQRHPVSAGAPRPTRRSPGKTRRKEETGEGSDAAHGHPDRTRRGKPPADGQEIEGNGRGRCGKKKGKRDR